MASTFRNYVADVIEEHTTTRRTRIADSIRRNGIIKTYSSMEIPRAIGSFLGKMATAAGYIAFAALVGELADHTPYLSTAVPDVMKAFTGSDYFFGNLDKAGATLGLFFSIYTPRFTTTRLDIGV